MIRRVILPFEKIKPAPLVAVMDASPSDQLIYGPDAWHTLVVVLTSPFGLLPLRNKVEANSGIRSFKMKKWKDYGTEKARVAVIRGFQSIGNEEFRIFARSATERQIIADEHGFKHRLGIFGNWVDLPGHLGERMVGLRKITSRLGIAVDIEPVSYHQVRILLWMADTIVAIRQAITHGCRQSGITIPPWSIITDRIALDTRQCHKRLMFINALLSRNSGIDGIRIVENPDHDDLADNVAGCLSSFIDKPTSNVGNAAKQWLESPNCPIQWAMTR